MYYPVPYCKLIQGIYYIYHEFMTIKAWFYRPLNMATTVYEREIGNSERAREMGSSRFPLHHCIDYENKTLQIEEICCQTWI